MDMNLFIHVCILIHVHVRKFMCVCVCVLVWWTLGLCEGEVHVCVRICVYICVYIYTHIYVCVCGHVISESEMGCDSADIHHGTLFTCMVS